MSDSLSISQAIDRIIFGSDSPQLLFEKYFNRLVFERRLFLEELINRLSPSRLEVYCDSIVWNEPSQPKYIYEEVHLKVAELKIRPSDPTDHMVVFRQREFAYELWKKNRFRDLQQIIPTIQLRLDQVESARSQEVESPTSQNNKEEETQQESKSKVGLHWQGGPEDLNRLYKELLRDCLIDQNTSEKLFADIFTRNRDVRDLPIRWNHSVITIAFLIRQLIEYELLIKPRGFYKDFETHSYFLPIGKDKIGNLKDAFIKSKHPSSKSRDSEIFQTIRDIVQRVVNPTQG